MPQQGVSLAIVVPTANRADLAITACESLIHQSDCEYRVFVSDNSTEDEQVQRLADYCRAAAHPRLTYLRPPQPLQMAAHWDWALRSAMEQSAATHFCIHYDRKITKPRHLKLLADLVAAFPDDMFTSLVDAVVNLTGRSRIGPSAWDGRVYIVPTAHVLNMTAQGMVSELGQAFPWLSNCTVPRAVLERVERQFGSICDSTTPDSCFAYRFCATHDRYLHFDYALGVLYGYHRSIGVGYLRGLGGDFGQFLRAWGDRPWLDAAPIPGLTLGQNILFHEYELVRRAMGGVKLQPVEMKGYLRELSGALRWVEDPTRAAEIADVLSKHGWTPADMPVPAAKPRATRVRDGLPWLATLIRDVWDLAGAEMFHREPKPGAHRGRRAIMQAAVRTALLCRRARASTERLLAEYLNIRPRKITEIEFADDADAIRFALRWSLPQSSNNGLDWMPSVGVNVTPAWLRDRLPA